MSRRSARALTIAPLESLEDRRVLAANPLESLVTAKAGALLGAVYTEYVNYYQEGSHGALLSAQSQHVEMVGATVGVVVKFGDGNLLANAADMQTIGMAVTKEAPNSGLIEGFVPIWQLPAVAEDPNMTGLIPVLVPSKIITPSAAAPAPPGPIGPTQPAPTPMALPVPATVSEVALKGGATLASIYQEFLDYERAGGRGAFTPAEAGQVMVSGLAVGVEIRTSAPNLGIMIGQLKGLGMDVTATTTAGQVGVIDGLLPIAQLPEVAVNAGLVGMGPIYQVSSFGAR